MYTQVKAIFKIPFGELPIEFIVENPLESTKRLMENFCPGLDNKDITYKSLESIPVNYTHYIFEIDKK